MILITAPTSDIGGQVLRQVLAAGHDVRVVARDPDKLPAEIADRVEVVPGSHGDPDVIDRASQGVDAAFWLTPNLPDAPTLAASFVDFARPAARAFVANGVARVVGISALGRGTTLADHAGLATASVEMDDLFADSGVAYRAVVNPSFMDNLLAQVGAISEQGTFFGTIDPDRRAPTVATRDIATTATRLLTETGWTGFEEVACLGPEDLSPNDEARIISDALGKPVTYRQIPGQAFKDRMMGFGMSDAMAQGLVDMFDAKNEGIDNAIRRTPQNSTPTTYREWCETVLRPALGA